MPDNEPCCGGTRRCAVNPVSLETARRVKERVENDLLRIDGVSGIGVGMVRGRPGILVQTDKPMASSERRRIPQNFEGVDVRIQCTGPFFVIARHFVRRTWQPIRRWFGRPLA